jgi:hypothetical protein
MPILMRMQMIENSEHSQYINRISLLKNPQIAIVLQQHGAVFAFREEI